MSTGSWSFINCKVENAEMNFVCDKVSKYLVKPICCFKTSLLEPVGFLIKNSNVLSASLNKTIFHSSLHCVLIIL